MQHAHPPEGLGGVAAHLITGDTPPAAGNLQADALTAETAISHETSRLPAGTGPTGFQNPIWTAAIYRHLTPADAATPVAVVIRNAGIVTALLPLSLHRQGTLTAVRFAGSGVTDYNAIAVLPGTRLGLPPAELVALIQNSLIRARVRADILLLDNLLADPAAPLAGHPAARPSRMAGNTLTLSGTVEEFLRARGKKYRKEAERSYRVLETHGPWTFARAETPEAIEAAFTALEAQQADRQSGKGALYQLAAPQFGAFYRDVLRNPDFGAIFTLRSNTEIVAVLLGIVHGSAFTLLRIANGGEAWKQASPGRLIVLETMRYFQARGVTTFDMGIGDYAFKRGFGTEPVPLVDVVLPLSWRGVPYVNWRHIKERLRRNPRLLNAVRAVKARLRPS